MLPILATSTLTLLGLLPLQVRPAPEVLAQGDQAHRSLPQNVAPSHALPTRTKSPGTPKKESAVAFVAPGYYGIYSNDKCREIYAACDLDGDDKIQYFEALKTLDAVSNPKDFRRLDKNNDGILRFPELDSYFKLVCEAGSNLVVKPKAMSRIHLRSESKKPKDRAILRWLALMDTNSDDKLDAKEWSQVSALLGDGIGAGFLKLDKDFSGSLTAEELRPLKPLFDRFEASKTSARHLRPLPESTRSVDLNDDGLLEMIEFSRALARIHPSLVQHAHLIFENADHNDDSKLDAIEVKKALALGTDARKKRSFRLR